MDRLAECSARLLSTYKRSSIRACRRLYRAHVGAGRNPARLATAAGAGVRKLEVRLTWWPVNARSPVIRSPAAVTPQLMRRTVPSYCLHIILLIVARWAYLDGRINEFSGQPKCAAHNATTATTKSSPTSQLDNQQA